jgi:acyl carrier protein
MLKRVEIEERLKATVADFIEDWGLDAELGPSTRLVEDLEFDSIDVIQLVVAIEKAFDTRSLGFQDLLMQGGRYVDDLSLGQIQAFIEGRLAAA